MGLGTMTFGEEWGWGASKEESRRIFDAYAEAGGNFKEPEEGRAKEGRGQDPEILKVGSEVVAVAREIGCTPTQVAVAWIREQSGVLIPLLGARTLTQLQDNLGALEVRLSPEQSGRLDQATRIDLGLPHEFLGRDFIRNLTHAGTWERINNHRKG